MTIVFALTAILSYGQPYWNQNLKIQPLRPPVGENPEFMDLNKDGRQDAVKSYIAGGVPILWLDDDGNMKEGDLEGDTVNDCLLVDRDKDGKYDLVVKFADLTGNGVADMQLIMDYPVGKRTTKNHMFVLDDDKDRVFNYIDWSKLEWKTYVSSPDITAKGLLFTPDSKELQPYTK